MKSLQLFSDKFAIGLSMLCTIHCLLLPVMMALLPSLTALNLTDERFHFWMLAAVMPTSLYALTMGCKQHQRYRVLVLGGLGLVLLIAGVFVGPAFGEVGEKTLTLIGACLVASGHLSNYQLCKQTDEQCDYACPEQT